MICGMGSYAPPPSPDSYCCWQVVNSDGEECTCWVAVFNIDPTTDVQAGPMVTRLSPCDDCAYRGRSREREDGTLDHVGLRADEPFMCHDGFPLVVELRHPDGSVASPWPRAQDYRPVTFRNRAWRADGRPALVCAGWASALRPLVASDATMPVSDQSGGSA